MKNCGFESAIEDINNLKSEVDCLKNIVKSFSDIKPEWKVTKKIHDNLRNEINQIKTENVKTENESFRIEGLFSCKHCPSQFGIKEHFESHMKAPEENESGVCELKCCKCEYVCQMEIMLRSHINAKHTEENINVSETDIDYMIEDNDFFQIEVVEDETVYA